MPAEAMLAAGWFQGDDSTISVMGRRRSHHVADRVGHGGAATKHHRVCGEVTQRIMRCDGNRDWIIEG